MAYRRQTKFSGGELSPLLWGRTDLEVYGHGLRTMRNFFPSKHGAAVSRPGTTFCGYTKFGTPGAKDGVRLIPFVYGENQSFVLEFGDQYIRFWTNGGQVLNGGPPLEVVTPWSGGVVNSLRFAQSGDVMYITSSSTPAQILTRISNTNWTLGALSYANLYPWFVDVGGASATNPPMVLTTDGLDSANKATKAGTIAGTYPEDAGHPAREWQWAVTVLGKDNATGRIFETLPALVTGVIGKDNTDSGHNIGLITDSDPTNFFPVYPDKPVKLRRVPTTGLLSTVPSYNTWTPLAYLYYRGRGATPTLIAGTSIYVPTGGLFGFVGQSSSRDFVDVGDPPDYTKQPPLGTNPFPGPAEYPYAVCFFQQRLALAGTYVRPNIIDLSATGDYYDFDPHVVDVAGESLSFRMDSRKREEVRDLVPHVKLVALCDTTVRTVAGTQNNPLDFDSIDVRLEEEVGCTQFAGGLIVDNAVIFPRSKGAGVRGLIYDWNKQGYVGHDLSVNSQHLFVGSGNPKITAANGKPYYHPATSLLSILSWTYAKDPWSVVWACLADGSFLSLTFDPANNVAGWARHDTDGAVISVTCVPEGQEDVVYFAVLRNINGNLRVMVERQTSRIVYGTTDDNVSLDCSIKYSAAPALVIAGLGHIEGKSVYVIGTGNVVQGPFTVVGGSITLDDYPVANNGTNADLYIGLAYTCDLEVLDLADAEVRMRMKTVLSVGFELDNAKGIKIGQSFKDLEPFRDKTVASGYTPPSNYSQFVRIRSRGQFDYGGRAALRQELPIPVTVLGLTREVEIGD